MKTKSPNRKFNYIVFYYVLLAMIGDGCFQIWELDIKYPFQISKEKNWALQADSQIACSLSPYHSLCKCKYLFILLLIINKPECRPVIGMYGISVIINHDWRPSIQSNIEPDFSLSCNCQNENKMQLQQKMIIYLCQEFRYINWKVNR